MKKLYQRGFTLIELLVVITLISILAVAVLATINPVEQRRKAIDSGAVNTAGELATALDRYFATNGCYPWDSDSPTRINCNNAPAGASELTYDNAHIGLLLVAGEVKQNLDDRVKTGATAPYDSFRFNKGSDESPHVCFSPTSKAYKAIADRSGMTLSLGSCTTGCAICVPDTQF